MMWKQKQPLHCVAKEVYNIWKLIAIFSILEKKEKKKWKSWSRFKCVPRPSTVQQESEKISFRRYRGINACSYIKETFIKYSTKYSTAKITSFITKFVGKPLRICSNLLLLPMIYWQQVLCSKKKSLSLV